MNEMEELERHEERLREIKQRFGVMEEIKSAVEYKEPCYQALKELHEVREKIKRLKNLEDFLVSNILKWMKDRDVLNTNEWAAIRTIETRCVFDWRKYLEDTYGTDALKEVDEILDSVKQGIAESPFVKRSKATKLVVRRSGNNSGEREQEEKPIV